LKHVHVDHVLEPTAVDRQRHQGFWRGLAELIPVRDELIERFSRVTGLMGGA